MTNSLKTHGEALIFLVTCSLRRPWGSGCEHTTLTLRVARSIAASTYTINTIGSGRFQLTLLCSVCRNRSTRETMDPLRMDRRLTFHYSDCGNVARELRVMQIMHDDWHMCKSKALHRSGKVSEDFFSHHLGEERQC
jgi:hypothetical protein